MGLVFHTAQHHRWVVSRFSMQPLSMPPNPRPAGASLAPKLDLNVESWVEWEERCLRPAVYGGDAAALAAAVGRLAAALAASGGQFLAAGQLTLADIVVYATLSPLAGGCCTPR